MGLARNRLGTKAHCPINASPPPSSRKKNRIFTAIKAYVTSGKVRRAVLSSPMGNMRFSSFLQVGSFATHRQCETTTFQCTGGPLRMRCIGTRWESAPGSASSVRQRDAQTLFCVDRQSGRSLAPVHPSAVRRQRTVLLPSSGRQESFEARTPGRPGLNFNPGIHSHEPLEALHERRHQH